MPQRAPAAFAAAAVILAVGSSVAVASPAAAPRSGTRAAVRALPSLDTQLVRHINAARAARGLPRLRVSLRLHGAAAAHSREMVQRGYFDHASADGTPAGERIRRFDRTAGTVGEALLWWSPDVSAAVAVQDWLAHQSHRAILLHPAFREIGVAAVHAAVAGGSFDGAAVTVITADFGAR